jgi:hypothetical protein
MPSANNIKKLDWQTTLNASIEAKELSGPLANPAFEVVEREDGRFAIGLADDAPRPFETRAFAMRVASGHPPTSAPVTKFRSFRIRGARNASS